MKKLFGILLAVMMVVGLVLVPTVFADSPTVTTVTWSGSGNVGTTVTAGTASTTSFGANANLINGSFVATDSNDQAYGGVDTVYSTIQSTVMNGSTYFQDLRTDAGTGGYGHVGQVDYAFVGSTGTGSMAIGSWTNYAKMCNGSLGMSTTPGGHNFEASGVYTIQQFIAGNANLVSGAWVPTDNYGLVTLTGDGTGRVDCGFTEASGDAYRGGETRLGWGGGCYTDADAGFTGLGTFTVQGEGKTEVLFAADGTGAGATNAKVGEVFTASGTYSLISTGPITTDTTGIHSDGNGTMGSANLAIVATSPTGWSINDYSLTAK